MRVFKHLYQRSDSSISHLDIIREGDEEILRGWSFDAYSFPGFPVCEGHRIKLVQIPMSGFPRKLPRGPGWNKAISLCLVIAVNYACHVGIVRGQPISSAWGRIVGGNNSPPYGLQRTLCKLERWKYFGSLWKWISLWPLTSIQGCSQPCTCSCHPMRHSRPISRKCICKCGRIHNINGMNFHIWWWEYMCRRWQQDGL